MKEFIAAIEDLQKAVRDGELGRYRRMAGKTVFIRSKDDKVTKGPNKLKGKKIVEKEVTSTAGMKDDLGSPSAEVNLSGGMKEDKRKKRKPIPGADSVIKSLQEGVEVLESVLSDLSSRNVR